MSGMQDNSNKGLTQIHFDVADIDDEDSENKDGRLSALG
jgi:hypothetical protein